MAKDISARLIFNTNAEVAGSNPAGVTNSLLTFYLSLHYGWRLTLKSQYELFASAMKYIGAEPIWLTGKFDKFVSH